MIFVVQCCKCQYSRRFAVELGDQRFRCPRCRRGELLVPKPPSDASSPGQERATGPHLCECSECGTLRTHDERRGGRLFCPDCRAERSFSASRLQAAVAGQRGRGKAEANERGRVLPFVLGLALGVSATLGAGLALEHRPGTQTGSSLKAAKTAKTAKAAKAAKTAKAAKAAKAPKAAKPKLVEAPATPTKAAPGPKLFETPTGVYPQASPSDFVMDDKVFYVPKVIDGDTLHLDELPRHAKVRLVGVDTPETKHVKKGVEFWGAEASAFTKKILSEQHVIVRSDKKNLYGVFGRPLVYLELLDGRDFNALLIRKGFARTTREYPFERLADYTKLEDEARAQGIGMWHNEGRVEFDRVKREKAEALALAARAAEIAKQAERAKLLEVAIANGGRYVHTTRSKTVHEPWCKTRPRTNLNYLPTLEAALEQGLKKHRCIKK